MNKVIAKKNIKNLLKKLNSQWDVYAPQEKEGKDVWMEVLPKDNDKLDIALEKVALGDEDLVVSAKDIFFPQVETMFEFNGSEIKSKPESSAKLLFGVKACDLAGIIFTDEFFKRNYEDVYYLSRIKERFVVVIGCLKAPRPNSCFCTSVDTGPFAKSGFDWQLVDLGDSYLIEAASDKGKELLDKYVDLFSEADEEISKSSEEVKVTAGNSIELKVMFKNAIEFMKQGDFNPEENYKRISERCLHCGACLYTCPTCTCFNVFDNSKGSKVERCRNWDACVFEGYTREASGHNPRKEKATRAARRYEHKLKYDYEVTGTSGCVGCGRCLNSCPVDIGMSKFIQEITEEKKII